MKKRFISVLLVLIIVFCAMSLSAAFAADTASIVVTADKTFVYPGDTVLFTVSVGAVNHLMGAEFVISIPSGMTYTVNSAAVSEGLADKVGFVSADWTESTMKFTAFGNGDYSNDDLSVFLTFSCKIDDNTSGEITPQITGLVLNNTSFEEIYAVVNTENASLTVHPKVGHTFLDGFCIYCGGDERILPYDLNGDSELNALDLSLLVTSLLTGSTKAEFDVNGDGFVNILDLIVIKKQCLKVHI